MSRVISTFAWPSRSCTSLGWIPALKARVAQGDEAVNRQLREVPSLDSAVEVSGESLRLQGLARHLQKTRSWSVKPAPISNRSSS
jgi:hypothetical protein